MPVNHHYLETREAHSASRWKEKASVIGTQSEILLEKSFKT
jgi:hypothetical protein